MKKVKLINATAAKELWQGDHPTAVMMRNIFDNLPAVEAAPVVHGKWALAGDGDGIVCSACGTDFCTLLNETKGFRYCPKCGARMDLEGSCVPVSFDDEILTNCNYEDEVGWDDDED